MNRSPTFAGDLELAWSFPPSCSRKPGVARFAGPGSPRETQRPALPSASLGLAGFWVGRTVPVTQHLTNYRLKQQRLYFLPLTHGQG